MRMLLLTCALILACSPASRTAAGDDPDAGPVAFIPHGASERVAVSPEPESEPEPDPVVTDPGSGPDSTPDPEPEPDPVQPDPEPEPEPEPQPTLGVGTYLNFGDSAGEGCCTEGGNKYAYYPMLVANDDALYPDYAGKDLGSKWPTISVTKNLADSGDTSQDVLDDQLPKLAASYSAPVIATIHVGGNDFNDHDMLEFLANPAKIDADGQKLGQNMDAILEVFEDPGRFPAGAFVFVATIFSPSDDQCGFQGQPEYDGKWCDALRTMGCLAPGWVQQLQGYNAAIAAAVDKHPNAFLVDTHAAFLGHGMNHGPGEANYFNTDCVHPNADGHDAIRRAMWQVMEDYFGA